MKLFSAVSSIVFLGAVRQVTASFFATVVTYKAGFTAAVICPVDKSTDPDMCNTYKYPINCGYIDLETFPGLTFDLSQVTTFGAGAGLCGLGGVTFRLNPEGAWGWTRDADSSQGGLCVTDDGHEISIGCSGTSVSYFQTYLDCDSACLQ
jgi:hypothetical protein